MTAFGTPELLDGALKLGACQVLNKPFELRELVAQLPPRNGEGTWPALVRELITKLEQGRTKKARRATGGGTSRWRRVRKNTPLPSATAAAGNQPAGAAYLHPCLC